MLSKLKKEIYIILFLITFLFIIVDIFKNISAIAFINILIVVARVYCHYKN